MTKFNYTIKNKTLCFMLLFFVFFGTACRTEPKNDTHNFKQDVSLSKYINPDMANDVLESNFGVSVRLDFANDSYAGILKYDELLIYDLDDKKISSAIDIIGLGFDRIQGDGAIEVSSNDEYLILNKVYDKKGYVYSFKDKYLSKVDDISKIDCGAPNYLDYDETDSFKSKIEENKDIGAMKTQDGYNDIEVIKTSDGYVAFIPNYDDLKKSELIKVNKNYDIVSKFKLKE